ncbi:MAG: hypothetical protein MH472_12545, partial [Bacteroidia bacterium]|nr:hypothetical protein [Bacteroidia bacterium]
MRINLENYEQYMIDYLESALSPETLVEFEKFLQLHNEIRQELELIKGVDNTVAIDSVVEPNLDFSYLKKSADARLNEEQLIAYMEG